MPRAQTPGPFASAAEIRRVVFEFDGERRRQLIEQLAGDLHDPALGSVILSSIAVIERETQSRVAERIVDKAEEQIILLLSAREDDLKSAAANAANIGHAIDQLRMAIEPFRQGWVDPITARIADWHTIDAALAERDETLKAMSRRNPDEAARFNAELIFVNAHQMARAAGFGLAEDAALRFTAAVLEAANVGHPDIHEHPARFRAFIDNATDGSGDERK